MHRVKCRNNLFFFSEERRSSSVRVGDRSSAKRKLSECAHTIGLRLDGAREGGMRTRRARLGSDHRSAALLHVVLRSCRSGPLVRDEVEWRKMAESIDSMLFWCGGRVFACRCEADRVEFAIEATQVPIGRMFRYVTVPYALHFNRSRGSTGPVFKRLRTFRIRDAFRTEFVLWLHRPLDGAGWTGDAAYQGPARLPWIDARALRKRQQQALLRSVIWFVARHFAFPTEQMAQRSRARRVCRARALVTLAAVRCGVSLKSIGELLARDDGTLQGTVLTLRARDPRGLLTAAEAILAEVRARRDADSTAVGTAEKEGKEDPEKNETESDADGAERTEPLDPGRTKGGR